jgi:flagellar FliL protein
MFAVLVFGSIAAGGLYFMNRPAIASLGDFFNEQTAEAETENDHNSKRSKSHAFVELDPLVLPVMSRNGVSQIVSLVVVIEIGHSDQVNEVTHLSPRLKDAFIQDMYGVLSGESVIKDGVLQVATIKQRLVDISKKVLGEDIARDVLLQVVQQRPI